MFRQRVGAKTSVTTKILEGLQWLGFNPNAT
jgi:hypothetical protein